MGELFGKLTNAGVSDPNTGQVTFPQPNAMPAALTPKPGMLQPSSATSDENGNVSFNQPDQQFPKLVKPTYEQAAGMGGRNGAPNALSPALSKAGKLATLLTSGLQGAMAGRAASENAVIQSGGRRSGGAGMGFEAGYQLPWQRAMQGQQLEQAKAQTEVTKAQGDMIPTPYGMMPAALAKVIFPAYIRAGATTGAAQIGAGSRESVAQTGAQARTGAAQIGADARVKAAELGLGPIAQVPQDLQQQFGLPAELPLRMLNQAETAANKPLTIVQGTNGPTLVNKETAPLGNLGVGSPRLGGAVQVADPDNPGNTKFETAGQAIKTGAAGTQSASLQVPRTAAKAEVPTKIGDQKVAFTTMVQHADLLRRAAKALNNGDTQTLNRLENAFKNEFGYSGPITSAAIADAYKGEVANVINKGHITDAGSEKVAHTLDPTGQNYQTIDSVLSAYQALAQSKMNMLNQQEQKAIDQSQPKKPGAKAANGATAQNAGTPPPGSRVRDYTQVGK